MADIEAMFYKVRIPPEQRSYLKFLWLKNSNTEALRHSAADNERQFGNETSGTLKRNFVCG